jgi:type I restriction enzyme M protein
MAVIVQITGDPGTGKTFGAKSLDPKNGRSVVLWPHGVLFRDTEQVFREKMIKDDLIEAVIGLGPNLFYNSPMKSCLLVTSNNKPKERKGRVIFINAEKTVTRESTISFLSPEQIEKIYAAYKGFDDIDGFSKIVENKDILANDANLNIAFYISATNERNDEKKIHEVVDSWLTSTDELKKSSKELLSTFTNKKA